MVRISKISIRDPSPYGHDRDWQPVITHVVSNLLKAPERWKIADTVGEYVKSLCSQSSCESGHILLGNAGIQIAIREFRREGLND
jgi:hypothetical protein